MNDRNKICAVLYYLSAAFCYISCVLNLFFSESGKDTSMGILWLCIGSTFLCLGSANMKIWKDKQNDTPDEENKDKKSKEETEE